MSKGEQIHPFIHKIHTLLFSFMILHWELFLNSGHFHDRNPSVHKHENKMRSVEQWCLESIPIFQCIHNLYLLALHVDPHHTCNQTSQEPWPKADSIKTPHICQRPEHEMKTLWDPVLHPLPGLQNDDRSVHLDHSLTAFIHSLDLHHCDPVFKPHNPCL